MPVSYVDSQTGTGGRPLPYYGGTSSGGSGSSGSVIDWGDEEEGSTEGPTFIGTDLVAYARSFIGVPYVWGGASSKGFDCSGFTQHVMKNFGVSLPHYSTSQFNMGTPVPKNQLQVGDLVFFAGSLGTVSVPRHVGIYIGNGQFIEAGSGGVHVSNLSSRGDYSGARRYSGLTGQLSGGEGAYAGTAGAAQAPSLSEKEQINDLFMDTLGRPATSAEINMISRGQWTDDHVFRYITSLPEFKGSPGWKRAEASYQAIWNRLIGNTPVPDSEMRNWITNRWTTDQVTARIQSLPEYRYGTEYKTKALDWTDLWEQKTGIPLTYTARIKRDDMLKQGRSVVEWEAWIETTDSYDQGIEMDAMRQVATDVLIDSWGYGVVQQKLIDNPDYIDQVVWGTLGKGASPSVIRDWARKQPEWIAGPEASTSKRSLRDLWGTIMRQPVSEVQLDQWVRDGVTPDQLYEDLRDTPLYQEIYRYKPAWMGEGEWHMYRDAFNSVGRQYFAPFQDYEIKWTARPGAQGITDPASIGAMYAAGWKLEDGVWYEPIQPEVWRYEDAQIGFFVANGITPQEMADRYRWTEDAWANLPTMQWLGKAIGRNYTWEDAYLVASGAKGSGKIRAEMIRAENLRQFDTVFAIYNDRAPTAADYAYLESNFVSPQEYSVKMQAIEEADAMFPEIDEMFMRVYGYHADSDRLRLVAQGAKGSGAYEALVKAAEELDRYTLVWRLYTKTDPSPQQYAEWAGLAGPEELAKMLEVKEMVSSQGPELLRVYSDYWEQMGLPGLTTDDIETLLGKYEGWGEIDAKMRVAQDHRAKEESARLFNLSAGAAIGWLTMAPFGGSKVFSMQRIQG